MKKVILFLVSFSVSGILIGKDIANFEKKAGSGKIGQRVLANCAAPGASSEIWVNNVRTIIFSGGDMWWDRNGSGQAFYYLPGVQNKATAVSSSFAGSIWLGGLDAGGQLKIAAMTYRQSGIDFWPGPLDTTNASADVATCAKFDQIFTITRNEVDQFVNNGPVTANISNWPGNGDVSLKQGRLLAPFVDLNMDGIYDPTSGDYPAYDVNNLAERDNLGVCKTKLYGDYTLFWVFNDNGGIHTETEGVPIGVEVRAQAFGFKTNDEINNMTFYSYEVFNRSTFQLNKTYFTIWNDADLGYFLDDYVGCDVKRGLGYIYNSDPFDETAMGTNGYQDFPPALGCDFFKGPLADPNDGIDNDNDNGVTPRFIGELTGIDEQGETIQMSRFTYYNNNYGAFPPQTTNPAIAIHFYNYMTGFWKDGSPFTIGGNAYGGTAPSTFVYDGNPVKGTGWTERGSGNPPGDRRFLQSAGPFTLKPGAVNEITFGLPWAQSPSKGGNIESLDLLFIADDKAQALFDNCFKLLDGPEAPIMTIQEISNELIVYLTPEKGRNNYRRYINDYAEEDISIITDPSSSNPALQNPDKFYRFEGYKVYQVRNNAVTSTDLGDPTKAILIFQCDVANGKGRLVNYEADPSIGGYVPKVMVEGADQGISSTFKVTEDAFSTLENRKLVNNKQYYFLAVAYAYNEYLPYAQDVPPSVNPAANSLGQKKPYLEGRKNRKAAGIPHITDSEKGGTVNQSFFGFGPKITRVEGQGNGGNLLTLTRASEDAIVTSSVSFVPEITYENARGPINIKVVDPLNVKNSEFSFKFIHINAVDPTPLKGENSMIPSSSTTAALTYTGTIATLNVKKTSWVLKDLSPDGKSYHPNEPSFNKSDSLYQAISVGNEFYFPELGFSLNIKQVADPGETVNGFTDFTNLTSESNYTGPKEGSFLGATITYEGGENHWLGSVPDVEGEWPFNWIHSGSNSTENLEDAYYKANNDGKVQAFYDPQKKFGNIIGSTWAPYPLCASYYSLTASTKPNLPARIFTGPAFDGAAWDQDDFFEATYATQQTASSPDRGSTDLRKMSSALVVFTRDRSKWTRCVVLEMQEKSLLSEGHAIFFAPRAHQSVDKDGKPAIVGAGASGSSNDPNFISETGMGWFPGYAINIETGERLNMAFGEDSYQRENHGDDMIWNPTSNFNSPFTYAMGGKHFVYVFAGNTSSTTFFKSTVGTSYVWEDGLLGQAAYVGRYDYGQRLMTILKGFHNPLVYKSILSGGALAPINAIERDIMWVSIPMPLPGFEFVKPDQMPSDVRVQINVSKPYRYGYSGVATIPQGNQPYTTLNKLISVNSPSLMTVDTSNVPKNYNFPMYTFNTSDIATLYDNADVAKEAMDQIMVVPNPYYGSSTYEQSRTDNRVRITNLPNKCTIKIFTMNGTLVRTIKRDVTGQEDLYVGTAASGDDIKRSKRISYVEWDLKNQNNISVASGLYIIHIDAPDLGEEKIIKWYGIMRPLDVQSY